MPSIHSAISRALEELERDLGSETFTFSAQEIPCVANDITDGTTVTVGGQEHNLTTRLFVRISDWLKVDTSLVSVADRLYDTDDDGRLVPVSGMRVTFRGQDLRVLSCVKSADAGHYVMNLGSVNR